MRQEGLEATRGARSFATESLLVLLVVLIAGFLVHPYRAQQASRYALTAAVVERGTVAIDDYEHVLGIDRAVRDGHTYSDKAPGQPLLAVPFFALGKLVGIEDGTILRVDENLGLWWLTFVSATVPGALLVIMMFRRAQLVDRKLALVASGGIFLGTLMLPFSSLLFGHVLAATFLYGSFLLIVDESGLRSRLVMAGVLAGSAVVVEYTAVLGLVVLLGLAVYMHRAGTVAVIIGGIPLAVAAAAYNWLAFGDPLTFSYQFSAFSEVTDAARPITASLESVRLDNALDLFFSGRGLAIATPVVLVALAGAILRLRRGFQPDVIVGLGMFAVFILIPLIWPNPWGGESPGPRYLTPALPFLCVPLVFAFRRWRLVASAALCISAVTMLAATFNDPLALPRDSAEGLGYWLRNLLAGERVDTLLTIGLGQVGWVLHLGILLVTVVLFRHQLRREPVEYAPSR